MLLFEENKQSTDSSPSFYMETLTVFNWGPFQGLHSASLHDQGTAIIGKTGSGKTTLVDAIMTLLTAKPRYNLASTGGHESDRDFMSYIRGVTGQGNASGDLSHILRKAKTVTGLSLTLSNGKEKVKMIGLFWVDGSSFSSSDRKDLWFFSRADDFDLEQILRTFEDHGTRELKRWSRDLEDVHVFDTRKAYLSHVRQFFEVGDKAFELLNRAAGLKQLNSIDDIFRDLVLEDNSLYQATAKVIHEFDDLVEIHSQIIIAKKQIESLKPIRDLTQKIEKYEAKIERLKNHKFSIPMWFCRQEVAGWKQKKSETEAQLASSRVSLEKLCNTLEDLHSRCENARDAYMSLGGDSIEALRTSIRDKKELLEQRQKSYAEYQRLASSLAIEVADTKIHFENTQRRLGAEREKLEKLSASLKDQVYDCSFNSQSIKKELSSVNRELEEIRARPGSNVPIAFQDFRCELAEALMVAEDRLPFIAELVQVTEAEQEWRGAIERAIGGHRLRIVVEDALVEPALKWINGRNNRLHVKVLRAEHQSRTTEFRSSGFCQKLTFKKHRLSAAAKSFLAGIDLDCIGDASVLANRPHCMTKQGLISQKKGRYEKQDRRPLNQGWMLGFSNKERLASLEIQSKELQKTLSDANKAFLKAEKQHEDLLERLQGIDVLSKLDFQEVDYVSVETEWKNLRDRLEKLTAVGSELALAKEEYEALKTQAHALETQKQTKVQQIGSLTGRLSSYEDKILALQARLEKIPRVPFDQEDIVKAYKLRLDWDVEELGDRERETASLILQALEKQDRLNMDAQKSVIRCMENAKKEDRGSLSEVGSVLEDTKTYLERLRELETEDLPVKIQRFQAYLNKSSDQGVTQLLQMADEEVWTIEERVRELNLTLAKVDFEKGKYFELLPQRVVHAELKKLQQAVKSLRSAAFTEDDGSTHFKALTAVIAILRQALDSKNLQSSKALMDPRYRLNFCVNVVSRKSGEVLEKRTGSQSGSGGEKETIASYILTASLCYALSPKGASKPMFSTIILDEAFSKSSQAVAGRIVAAIREFGLHPLFITPNKELKLLERHTRSAILVHRRLGRSFFTSLSWDQLKEELAKTKESQAYEVTHRAPRDASHTLAAKPKTQGQALRRTELALEPEDRTPNKQSPDRIAAESDGMEEELE